MGKKIIFLIAFFFFIPIVKADVCDTYQCITCIYEVENYNVKVEVKSSGVKGEGNVKRKISKNSGKSLTIDSNNLSKFENYIDTSNEKLYCPPSIYGEKKSSKVTLNFTQTNKYKTMYVLSDRSDNYNPLYYKETDWGPIEDTNIENICNSPNLRKPLKFIGTIVFVLKIAIPILIIVLGIIDLFKAIPSSKDDRIIVAVKSIGVRFIAGIFIFFIPGIIQVILDWVNEWSNYSNSWCCCTQCLLDSGNCDVNSCSSDSCKIGGMN